MATADKLNKLLETKAKIRHAIGKKGVEVADDEPFANYHNKIAEISGGSDDFIALRTSNHTNYEYLFASYKGDSLESFGLENWNTSEVTDMSHMFTNCKAKDYNLSNWDFSKVTDTSSMFSYSDAVDINLSSWYVGPEIKSLNMGQMFIGCYDLETLDIRNLNIAIKVTIGNAFYNCSKLHTLRLDRCENDTIRKIIESVGFPTGLVDGETRKMWVLPKYVAGLTAPDGWDFIDCSTGEVIAPEKPEIPLYQPDMFRENRDIEEVSVMVTSEHDNLESMFQDCENLKTINGINKWDTSNVTTMTTMFYSCRSLESLDLSSFNTSNVTSMYDMFSECENLRELNLSNFVVRNDCNTDFMLNNCRRLHTLHLDYCEEDTIRKIIESFNFPTGGAEDYEGTRQIFVNPDNVGDLTEPDGWEFVNVK